MSSGSGLEVPQDAFRDRVLRVYGIMREEVLVRFTDSLDRYAAYVVLSVFVQLLVKRWDKKTLAVLDTEATSLLGAIEKLNIELGEKAKS